VVARGGRYFAVSDNYPRINVPLEMWGEGTPRILQWEMRAPPLDKAIGTLRYSGGKVAGKSDKGEETEFVAIIDVQQNTVVAIEPHRQGEKVATWTWEEGKVVVASADGVTDEFVLRDAKALAAAASPVRRYSASEERDTGWSPWGDPWAGGNPDYKPKRARRKPKTIFDLLFN
jgi:hypothetical protein